MKNWQIVIHVDRIKEIVGMVFLWIHKNDLIMGE